MSKNAPIARATHITKRTLPGSDRNGACPAQVTTATLLESARFLGEGIPKDPSSRTCFAVCTINSRADGAARHSTYQRDIDARCR